MNNNWQAYALGSAFFAGLTAIFGKCAVGQINSNLATLIRTLVILLMILVIVIVRNEWRPISELSHRSLFFLVLSGAATGLSWLCYYRALQLGTAAEVAPVDKLSVAFVLVMAWLFLGEPFSLKGLLGTSLVIAGSLVIASK